MKDFAWGTTETKYFFELTPDRILDEAEASGLLCTGRVLTLNSMENRVYEVEVEVDPATPLKTPSERFRVLKFYRPGRWSEQQILEEHRFLNQLVESEIPAVPAIRFSDGKTLHKMKDVDIWFAVFPKMGGRNPDEFTPTQMEQMGRLLARLHNVGASEEATHRIPLTPQTYGINNLRFLIDSKKIPSDLQAKYQSLVEQIVKMTEPWFALAGSQRLHGDCHLGNVLWNDRGVFLVDFDDMVRGPCVQDMWLLLPGRDAYAKEQLGHLLDGYEQMRDFDYTTLRLIEPLRALRFIHFSAWIGKRWEDPVFQKYFSNYGTPRYWEEQVADLQDQWEQISSQTPFGESH